MSLMGSRSTFCILFNWDMQDLERKATGILQQEVEALLKDNVNASYYIAAGNSTDEILKFANSRQVDLLILGSQDHSYVHNFFIGSTASNLIRNCSCPLLVVKREPIHHYEKVIVGIDFSESSRNALRNARLVFQRQI